MIERRKRRARRGNRCRKANGQFKRRHPRAKSRVCRKKVARRTRRTTRRVTRRKGLYTIKTKRGTFHCRLKRSKLFCKKA